jgi:hypothetical protein
MFLQNNFIKKENRCKRTENGKGTIESREQHEIREKSKRGLKSRFDEYHDSIVSTRPTTPKSKTGSDETAPHTNQSRTDHHFGKLDHKGHNYYHE